MKSIVKNKVFHVISNTHWDREWRYPFQRNRQMLVDMIDRVLEILEQNPDYRAFHLDSQSIVLKDYLEIKPHKKDIISKFLKNKRLLAGPWYILPEEYQVGGENLIRNLLLGHKVAEELGRVSKIGYSPFSWGQISQLPQIYRQFDINLIMFYRGINSIDSPNAEFLWKGADGTEAVSSRFSTMPRYNFYFYIYRPAMFDEGFADVEHNWKKEETPFHFADKFQADEDWFVLSPEVLFYEENISPSVKKIINDQASDFTTRHIIWMEGHDSSGPNTHTTKIIASIKDKFPGIDLRHSTLEDYAKLLDEEIDRSSIKVVEGERRSAQYDLRSGNLYGYTTSARMYLKQINFNAERWIQFYAEPFNIWSAFAGRDINDTYPETAWELIIQNSAHDSIGGCSLDSVHEDMEIRYKQAIEISKGVFERSAKHIIRNLDTSPLFNNNPETLLVLTAINGTNFSRSEVADIVIDIPAPYDKGSVDVLDSSGSRLPVQIIKRNKIQPVLEQMINRPKYYEMVRYEAKLSLAFVPQSGLKSYSVLPADGKQEVRKYVASMNFNKYVLENSFLKLTVNNNGTFDLIFKKTGKIYKNLGYFYDEGEAGHAWENKPAEPFITSLNSTPLITLKENGPLFAEAEVKHLLSLPPSLEARKNRGEFVDIPVTLRLALSKDSERIDINIELDNKAESHRLRIMFPLELNAEYSHGEGQFDVVKRKIAREDTTVWVEQPMYDYPMHHFVDLSNDSEGAAILVDGLKEYEVLDDNNNTLAITLLRAFEYVIASSSRQEFKEMKGSQCPGKHNYKLSFYPHSGDWQKGRVYREALKFNIPLRFAQSGEGKGNLPHDFSFLKISDERIILSSVKKAEKGKINEAVIRFYNPCEEHISFNISFAAEIKEIAAVSLEELEQEKLSVVNGIYNISIKSKEIKSVKINFGPIDVKK